MTKKTNVRVRTSTASAKIASLDLFGMAVKAARRKVKPTLKLNPIRKPK